MTGIIQCLSTPGRWLLVGRQKTDKGQGLVEYAMMLSLVAVVVISALTGLGTKVASLIAETVAAF
jgi:Flp pilus assembly pilin Flp